jgi:uncharacterized protein YjbI with pentapeptide repeats
MKYKVNHLKKILDDHKNWVLSRGEMGKLADFSGWNLANASLEMADLSLAKLHQVSLKDANLWGVYLSKAELNGADLNGAKISGGDLSFAQCEGANFTDANLEDANFEGANLQKTNFTGAFLRRARFKGADISFSQFVDANIEGADFKGAKIVTTNFEGANIDDADFDEIHNEILNNKNHLPQANFKDDKISNPLLYKTKSPESVGKNHKSDKAGLNKTSNIKSAKEGLFVDLDAIEPARIEEAIFDLIEKLKSNIQFDQLEAISKNKGFIDKIAEIDFRQGDIVTHNGQIAFKLDFNISYNFSLLLDRNGKLRNVYSLAAKDKEK